MAICPLLREECRGEQCAWWFETMSGDEHSQCVISLLPDLLKNVDDDINDIYSQLDNVDDDIKDIYSQLDGGITVYTWSND